MDVLSDVLLAVRLTGAVFFDVEAGSPFATESPPIEMIADRVMAGSGHVINFHTMMQGSCWAEAIGGPPAPVHLQAGEIVLYPMGDANILASAPGMRGQPDPTQFYRPPDRQLPFPMQMNPDDGAEKCHFVCGFFGCDSRPFNPLLSALPRLVHASISAASRGWLANLIRMEGKVIGYQATAGREAMLAKLAELMFVEVMISHIDSLPENAVGWFAGLRDPQIGAALRLIHGRPTEPWTLDTLAREIGLSRSSLAERFTTYVEMPPMQYIARWRLQIAARLLETPNISVAQVAAEVGYQSEAAFNRAFKRHTGVAPGAWRRDRRVEKSNAPLSRNPQ
jgi:AraC-like DNA-binding protein